MSRGRKIVDLVLNKNEYAVSSSLNQDPANYDETINQPSTSSGALCASLSSPERSDSSSSFPTTTKRRRCIVYSSDSSNDCPVQETRVTPEMPSSQPAPQFSQSKARRNRLLGKPYVTYKRKEGKIEHTTAIAGRSVKSRCSHTAIKQQSKNSFMCKLLTEEERAALHFKFWSMKSWSEKKAFIQGLVSRRNLRKRRKRGNRISSRKQSGFDIYVPKSDCQNSRVKVCRLFFLNTFDLGRDTFLRWVKDMPPIVLNNNYQSIRPGKRKGDPTVNDVRAFLYKSTGEVYFKLRHPQNYTILPQRRPVPQEYPEPATLYDGPLEITKSKFDQLQELKPFIDRDYHPFYDCLNVKSD